MPAPAAIFAHSYAALQIFRAAKAIGSATVLGQIDPGQAHLDVVAESVLNVFQNPHKPAGLRMVYEPECLRFFQARFEPME